MKDIPAAAPSADNLDALPLVDIDKFNTEVIGAYNDGLDDDLEADLDTARSIIPAGTGAYRDFSYIAPELPFYDHAN